MLKVWSIKQITVCFDKIVINTNLCTVKLIETQIQNWSHPQ